MLSNLGSPSVIHLADIVGKELVPDPLNLAAELQVSQIPPEMVSGIAVKWRCSVRNMVG